MPCGGAASPGFLCAALGVFLWAIPCVLQGLFSWCDPFGQFLLLSPELVESFSGIRCLYQCLQGCPLFPPVISEFQFLYEVSEKFQVDFVQAGQNLLSAFYRREFGFPSTVCGRGCLFSTICLLAPSLGVTWL